MTDELDSLKDYASALEEERCRVEGGPRRSDHPGDLERKGRKPKGS